MRYGISALLALCTYGALAFWTIAAPTDTWEMVLNIAVPFLVAGSLTYAFHFRSTPAFAFAAFMASTAYIVTMYGGYLLSGLITLLIGTETDSLYHQDIVYNHVCIFGGIAGYISASALTRLPRSENGG